MYVMYVRLTHI